MSGWLPSLFIKGSNHKYIPTKYVVLNKKLVIAKEHMLETKNKSDFFLSMSVLSPDMLWMWLLSFYVPHMRDIGSSHF